MGYGDILQASTTTIMFHKIVHLRFLEGVSLELVFLDGKVVQYDMSNLFNKYPRLEALRDRKLFLSGKKYSYGIRWNDELDIDGETIYQEGKTIRVEELPINLTIAYSVLSARNKSGLSQTQLSKLTGIDQADISKIESGRSNPSIVTLKRIADALGIKLRILLQ